MPILYCSALYSWCWTGLCCWYYCRIRIHRLFQISGCSSLAKYAGLTWRESQSGKSKADEPSMTRVGNIYLRYYLLEATTHLIWHDKSYAEYYHKKFDEVKLHQHKRALILTARNFVRFIFGLLANNQLYSKSRESLT